MLVDLFTMEPNATSVFEATTEDEEEYVYDEEDNFTYYELGELVPVTVIYGLTLILGVVGNSLIIFTIVKYRGMRSITNVFLASLASADLLLVVICIPVKFAKLFSYTWTMGEFMCKFVHYVQNVSAICSVLTLTSMSLERYYAILHPMKAKYICTISQARKIIIGIWILSILMAIPIVFVQVMMPAQTRDKEVHYWCVVDWQNPMLWRFYELYMLILLLILPTIIMAYAYTSICFEVWLVMKRRAMMTAARESRNGKDPSSLDSHPMTTFVSNERNSCHGIAKMKRHTSTKSNDESVTVKQVIKMLVAVVVLFVVCWTPILVTNALTAFGVINYLNYGYLKPMRTIFHLLAYFNSCINPIVYGFMSRNFRDSFFDAICPCRSTRPTRQLSFSQTRTTSVSIGRSYSVSTNDRHINSDAC